MRSEPVIVVPIVVLIVVFSFSTTTIETMMEEEFSHTSKNLIPPRNQRPNLSERTFVINWNNEA